jgi:hypothetical protein
MRWLVLGSLFLLGSCGRDVTKDIEKLADRACECKDADCAKKVVDELVTLAQNNKNARGDSERATKAATKLGECVIKAGVDPQEFMAAMSKISG